MHKIAETLARVPLFQGIKDNVEALNKLEFIMRPRSYKKGHKIIKEGEFGDEFFILIKGQVSVFKNTPDGDGYKVVILQSEKTPTFGEGALIEAEPRSATITCDEDSDCLVLDRKDFQQFTDQYPQWAVPILRRVAMTLMGRLRTTSNDMMLLYKALVQEVRTG